MKSIIGWRKLLMFFAALAVITFADLPETNATVFQTLIIVSMAANVGSKVSNALGNWNISRNLRADTANGGAGTEAP
jgi:hypothetical protein